MKHVILSIVFLGMIYLSCSSLFDTNSKISVELKVTGTAKSVSITYVNEDGGTSQVSSVSLPWSYSYNGTHDDFYYVSAQNNSETGTVTTKVLANSKEIKSSTSSGAYVIATSSGSL